MSRKLTLLVFAAIFAFGGIIFNPSSTSAVDCTDGTAADSIESCPESQADACSRLDSQNSCAPVERIAVSEDSDLSTVATVTEPTDEPAIEDDPAATAAVIATEPSTDSDRSLWPMYLSLGALGFALLLIMVLNLRGKRQEQA